MIKQQEVPMRGLLSLRKLTFFGLLVTCALGAPTPRAEPPPVPAVPGPARSPVATVPPAAYGPQSCAELAAKNRAVLSAALRARPRLRAEFQRSSPLDSERLRSYDELLGRCLPQKDGFVGLMLRPGGVKGCAGDCDDVTWKLSLRMSIVRVADGRVTEADRLPSSALGAVPARDFGLSIEYAPQIDRWVDLLGAFDYDGDGNLEVLLALGDAESGESPRMTRHLLTLVPRALRAYPHSPPLGDDSRMEDVDGDGRPDLVTRGVYESASITTCGGADDDPAVAALFVQHALMDGRFSATDAVARAALARACPSPPPASLSALRQRILGGQETQRELARAVVCARAHAPAKAVMAELAAGCRRWVEGAWSGDFIGCGDGVTDARACPMWLKRLIAIEPTLQLTR
ncbi:MAG: hypothetical protein U1A78_06780 [Polyangia bacterium]